MKIRIFQNMDDMVYRIVMFTEDWSQGDVELMVQYGEPEIDVGGEVEYIVDGEQKSKTFGDEYIRLIHGFPYSRGFDARDYDSVMEAISLGNAWKDKVVSDIRLAIAELRSKSTAIPTEEVISGI